MNFQTKFNTFQPLALHRETIATELANIQVDTSAAECMMVKSCISNAKNIIVKLDDLRTAQDHYIREFCVGVFNVIGGALAVAALAPFQAISCGKAAPEAFSAMIELVKRGVSRCENARKSTDQLNEEIAVSVGMLNDELALLPEFRKTMHETQKAVQEIKGNITAIANLEVLNGFKVEENMPTRIAGTRCFEGDHYEAPFFDSLRELDADEFEFVKLVNSFSTVAITHLADLNLEIQTSLETKALDDMGAEEIDHIFDDALQVDLEKLAKKDEESELTDELTDDSLVASESDSEFASSFEVNVEIGSEKQ